MSNLHARRIHVDDRHTVIVVEAIAIYGDQRQRVLGLYARTHPVAVIVKTTDCTHALDISGLSIDVSELIDDVENLAPMLK